MLINILILFFIYLIGYQLFLGTSVIEGLEKNTDCDTYKTSLENAAQINVLKEQVDGLEKKTVGLPDRLDSLQNEVNELAQSVAEMGNSLPGAGGAIEGTDGEEEEEVIS
jgi:Tfp pilus assembly protein PilO